MSKNNQKYPLYRKTRTKTACCALREAAMSNRPEGSPSVYHTAELQESCRIIEEAAAKRASGFFGLTLTQEQAKCVAFAILEQIESLEEGYEADEPEVKEAIECLCDVQRMMKR